MNKNKVFVTQGDIILDKFYDKNLNVIHQDGGGCNWNVLYNLSKNLGQSCYGFGTRGNDIDGDFAVNALQESGINTQYIEYENKSTNVMNVIIPSGKLNDNSVIHTWYSPITNELTIHFSNKLPTKFPTELKNKDIYVVLDKFRKINMDFIDCIENKKVCLDIGHVRYIRHFKKDYLLKFLRKANFILLNDTTAPLLFKKLGIKDEFELFDILNLDLFVLTAGKNKTTFIINKNGKKQVIYKYPKPIENVVDTTGAGDAFFATLINEYSHANKIDESFVNKAFDVSSKNSAFVLMNLGARLDWKI